MTRCQNLEAVNILLCLPQKVDIFSNLTNYFFHWYLEWDGKLLMGS